MPSIPKGAKILVTGANGYLAAWIVEFLLQAGYQVRGAVRSATKAVALREKYASYGDLLETVIVPDMALDGAYDDAVEGVDAIEHTAALVSLHNEDPQEFIDCALKGTLAILQSALKRGQGLRRIIITSSTGCVMGDHGDSPVMLSELDWNTLSAQEVDQKGWNASNLHKYKHAKVLAEKAAWEFYESHKSKGLISWDLTTVLPPYIFGPFMHDVAEVAALNASSAFFYKHGVEREAVLGNPLKRGGCWVDVRDAAKAHVSSLEREDAGGERIIVSAGPWIWSDWHETIDSLDPSRKKRQLKDRPQYLVDYDVSKARRILGQSYRTMQETVGDVLRQLRSKGW